MSRKRYKFVRTDFNTISRSNFIPNFIANLIDGRLSGVIVAVISRNPKELNADATKAFAASPP